MAPDIARPLDNDIDENRPAAVTMTMPAIPPVKAAPGLGISPKPGRGFPPGKGRIRRISCGIQTAKRVEIWLARQVLNLPGHREHEPDDQPHLMPRPRAIGGIEYPEQPLRMACDMRDEAAHADDQADDVDRQHGDQPAYASAEVSASALRWRGCSRGLGRIGELEGLRAGPVVEGRIGQGQRPPFGAASLPADGGARRWRFACREVVDDLAQALGSQIP